MKIKGILCAFATAVASVALTSCGISGSEKWGEVCEKTIIKDSAFNSIKVNGIADVVFSQSDTIKVTVKGHEKAIEKYDIAVNNNTLSISTKNGSNIPSVTVYVSAPSLNDIDVNGTGDITITNDIKIEGGFKVDINGTGDFNAKKIECDEFTLNINGTGDADIKKITSENKASISVSGTGDFKSDIKAKTINAGSNGTGDIDINVECNDLVATASGTGDVKIKGNCKNFQKHESGLASVDSRELKYDKKK